LCTFFTHDETQDSFNGGFAAIGGELRLTTTGEIVSTGTTTSSSTETTISGAFMTLTVVKSTFDTVGQTGACQLTGTISGLEGILNLLSPTDPYSSLEALIDWDFFELAGTTGVEGLISGELTLINSGSSVVSASQRPFSLVRFADCEVFPTGTTLTTLLPLTF
jgi:hypothetical protein